MKLITLPNKIIRTKSKKMNFPLSKTKIKLIEEMIKHIDDSQKPNSELRSGVGLAAVQVGFLDRMYYIHAPASGNEPAWKEFLINPIIIKTKGPEVSLEDGEGCLSVGDEILGQEGLVHRINEVTVQGYSYFQKKEVTITKQGYQAIVIQHEQDHLNAKLFIDKIDKFNIWKVREKELLI